MSHIALAALVGASAALAQDITFVARVEPVRVAAGEQFEVSFTLSGTSLPKYENFTAPDFGQFVVLSGPNSSTSVQYVNGRMSSSLSFTYFLYARQPGAYTLGQASIEVGGVQFKSKPVKVDVVPPGKKPQAQKGTTGSVAGEISENLFIRATADKQRVKQGEQFVLTYKLYTRVNIENYIFSKAPTYEGLWAEDLEQPRSPEISTEVIEGKQFRVATLKRTALFATQPGKLKVSPLEVRCAVRIQSQRRPTDPFDIFNDPFFSPLRTEEVDVASNGLTITVDRLPGSAAAGFTGAIGKYSLGASINKNEGRTGEPLTLTLAVSGFGNIKLVSVPRPEFPADFEVYEPKVTEEISREGGIIRGKKTAEYLMIPRNAGERVIEPVPFVYFDLEKNGYVTLRSSRFELPISPGRDIAAGGGPAAYREEVRLLGEDIRFLKLSPGSTRLTGETPFASGWFFSGLIVPPVLFVGALMYRKRQEKMRGNSLTFRAQKAGREASKRLKTARKLLAQGNAESYHAEIARALFGYLSDKLGIPLAALTVESAAEELKRQGVSPDVIGALQSCIERAEFVRFAPGSDSRETRKDLLETAARTITLLEKSSFKS